ncbi:hypothetical protein BGX38DRAFT_854658 [Terfezia claveryi]|nr:hypothetical protein BGX38DRAFT_854658 [Terfezia claveryi]
MRKLNHFLFLCFLWFSSSSSLGGVGGLLCIGVWFGSTAKKLGLLQNQIAYFITTYLGQFSGTLSPASGSLGPALLCFLRH